MVLDCGLRYLIPHKVLKCAYAVVSTFKHQWASESMSVCCACITLNWNMCQFGRLYRIHQKIKRCMYIFFYSMNIKSSAIYRQFFIEMHSITMNFSFWKCVPLSFLASKSLAVGTAKCATLTQQKTQWMVYVCVAWEATAWKAIKKKQNRRDKQPIVFFTTFYTIYFFFFLLYSAYESMILRHL